MEALAELAIAIVTFIFEVTIHALVFVFLLVMSIFSPRYRHKLKEDWKTSGWKRFSIVLGISLYSIALVIALFVWIPVMGARDAPTASNESESSITIQLSSDEIEKMKKTKEIVELVDVAGSFIKRKLEERKQKAEQDGDDPAAAAVDSKAE